MRKITLLIALVLMGITGCYAQASLYGFSQSSGTYTPITGGTVITATTNNSPSLDDYSSAVQTLPADFEFGGLSYTTYYVTSNGSITLGGATGPSSSTYRPLSSSFGSNVVLSPFGADLNAGATGVANIRTELVGSEIVVQWTNFRRYNKTETFNFQIRLNTADKSVKFVYDGTPPFAASTDFQPQVGIKSATGDYKALTSGSDGTWVTPTVITSGISDSSTLIINGSAGFTSGLTYTFTAPPSCTAAPVAGTISGGATRSLCAGTVPAALTSSNPNTTVGFAYEWEQSADGATWVSAVGGTGANTLTYTPPAFEGVDVQYRLKTTCVATNEAVFTAPVSIINQVAPTTQVSALVLTSSITSITANWTNGNGGRRLVIVSTTPIEDPISEEGVAAYAASTSFAGTGQQVVYDGTGTSVTVSGFACNTLVYVTVYEYNRCGTGPYDVYINSSLGANAGTVTTASPVLATLPASNNFSGYTGSNISTVFPGWYEASIATASGDEVSNQNPSGTDSNWGSSSVFSGVTTARINLYYNTANAWIISPKVAITAESRLRFKAAITEYFGGGVDPERMQETDDMVNILVSTDACGAEWTPVYTFDASNTEELTNVLTDFTVSLNDYIGQTIQIAFQGTDGPSNDDPDYDFHIGNIVIEVVPGCDGPVNVVAEATGYNTGTLSWTAPSVAPAEGYEYYYSTTNTAPAETATPNGNTAAGVITVDLANLSANTTYYIWVRSVCSTAEKSPWEAGTSLYTGPCVPTPGYVDGDGITNITIGTIDNETLGEDGNYANYTNLSTDVSAGTNVPFSITYSTGYTYNTKIWIDWNDDTVFDDETEVVYEGESTNADPTVLSGSIAIPGSADIIGSHTMRIGGIDSGDLTPCYSEEYGYGSFEDYTINVVMPDAPVVTAFTPASYCAVDGVITITGTALANATLTIGGTAVTPTTNTDTQIVATVPAGVSGTVTVTTFGGTFTTATGFEVNTPAPLTLSAAASAICAGTSTAAVTVTSDIAAYDTYVWSPATGVTGNAATGFVFAPTQTTTYTLTATQSNGDCVKTATHKVTVNANPIAITVAASGSVACAATVLPLVATGGTIGGEVTIGTATTFTADTEQPTAFNNRWSSYWTQSIYTAAELTAAGVIAGNISSIAYNVASLGSGATNPNFTVKIGTASGESFANENFLSTTGFTTVYGPQTYTHTASGWQVINFSTPYVWDGVSNIVINITMDGANSTNNTQTAYTATTANTVLWRNNFSGSTTTGELSPKRLNIRFNNVVPTAVSWSPATNLYTDADAVTPYVAGATAGTVYFKSSTAGAANYTVTSTSEAGCTTTAAVNLTVNVTEAPAAPATQTFCSGATVAQLEATGTALAYYAAATGGTALAATAALSSGNYYVSQTLNNCESLRTAIAVVVNVVDAPAVAAPAVTVCNAGTVADLVATGANIQWYAAATGGTALAGTTAFTAGTTTYYASQTVNGCESAQRTAVAVTLTTTAAPEAAAAQTFCSGATVAEIDVTGTGVQWFTTATGGDAVAATTTLTSGTYYAAQTVAGCTSAARTAVVITITTTDAPVAAATQTFCNQGIVSALDATGTGIQWYTTATGGSALQGDVTLTNGTTYYASATANGCESATRTAVTVVINTVTVPDLEDVVACNSYVLPALNSGAYYTQAAGAGTLVAAGTAITATTTLYVYAATGTCTDESQFTITVNSAAPVQGASPQVVTVTEGPATIDDIVITATGSVTWYASEAEAIAGTNPLGADFAIQPNTTYYVIQTIGECTSTVVAITVSEVLGNKGFDAASFSYYPNPVNNVLNLQYSSEITSVEVFNLLGQQVVVIQPNATNAKVDMTPLAEGTYMVTVKAGADTKTIKVVKKVQ